MAKRGVVGPTSSLVCHTSGGFSPLLRQKTRWEDVGDDPSGDDQDGPERPVRRFVIRRPSDPTEWLALQLLEWHLMHNELVLP